MLKIKKVFLKILNWFASNAWIQLLIIVGSIFGFLFSLPYIVNFFKSKDENTKADNFYYKYQIDDFDNDGKSKKFSKLISDNNDKIIVFIPKNNNVARKHKNVIESLIKKYKINFKVIVVDDDQKYKFYKIYSYYKKNFFNDLFNVNKNCPFFPNCMMQKIADVEDFFNYPVMVLLKKNKINKVISNICGDYDQIKKQNLYKMLDLKK